MNSINQQQIEENIENLEGTAAIDKIKELVGKTSTCFFCSNIKTGIPFSTRPMSVQKVDDDGNLWFLSADDSNKDMELKTDPFVQLLFQGSPHSDFLNLYGIASVSKDKQKIEEMWEPIMKTWFTGGKDDPRISVIRVEPSEAYYWDNKHGNAVAFLKMMVGAAIGKTLDDSIEGKLEV
ncbi:pyridoxamine 5'-phosphate oxidase family protein [Mucilaginibacter sp.]|jgi:general stress protein 26|uniref:pyridoxamine 5'-phosphate oxidase family protein n=1 Tax=Mucilaginibacter sp. TaxID=1882438 RepID=UPI002C803C59|nr:pyridoxamine 5'-phosphate oxidase family protein [Mucilaginibacter sp.]HTI58019.1 pyridoxamine 5'-phosphate oxidase family protein [Mucilaginibacter sp.]